MRPESGPKILPKEWKLVKAPLDRVHPAENREGHGGGWLWPESVDGLVRDSVIVLVGTCVGFGGSFYHELSAGARAYDQYSTYYIRVDGYLKDRSERRTTFVKVLAPGGELKDAFQGDSFGFPYLELGRRYLLYLTENNGVSWGLKGANPGPDHVFIGQGDEYWTTGAANGRWFPDSHERLSGRSYDEWQWAGLGYGLPFGEGLSRVKQAVDRERRGQPPIKPYLTNDIRVLSPKRRAMLLGQPDPDHAPR